MNKLFIIFSVTGLVGNGTLLPFLNNTNHINLENSKIAYNASDDKIIDTLRDKNDWYYNANLKLDYNSFETDGIVRLIKGYILNKYPSYKHDHQYIQSKLEELLKSNKITNYFASDGITFDHIKLPDLTAQLINKEAEQELAVKSVQKKYGSNPKEKFIFQSAVIHSLIKNVPITIYSYKNRKLVNIEIIQNIYKSFQGDGVVFNTKNAYLNINKTIFSENLDKYFDDADDFYIMGDIEKFNFSKNETQIKTPTVPKEKEYKVGDRKFKRNWNFYAYANSNEEIVFHTQYGINLTKELGIIKYDDFLKHYKNVKLLSSDNFKLLIHRTESYYSGIIFLEWITQEWLKKQVNNDTFEVKNIRDGNRGWYEEYDSGKINSKIWVDLHWVRAKYYSSTVVTRDKNDGTIWLFLQYEMYFNNSENGGTLELSTDFGDNITFELK